MTVPQAEMPMNQHTALAKPLAALLMVSMLMQSACLPGPTVTPTGIASSPTAFPASSPTSTRAAASPEPTSTAPPAPSPTTEPQPLVERVSEMALFDTLRDLTSIQAHRGWRSSGGTPGEREAQDYIARRLDEMARLTDMGLTVTHEDVPVYLSTRIHDVRLTLRVAGREEPVPAQAPWGHIDNAARAAQFDTDGEIGDTDPNPVTVQGLPRIIATVDDLESLPHGGMLGQVLFVSYALLDPVIYGPSTINERATALRNAQPAAIVLVTTYGERTGQSTGTYALDRPALTQVDAARVPAAVVRLEDLEPAGVKSLADLTRIEEARLTVDVDILSPARSANLVTRIPGADESRRIILGAHIDSANTPGALDDGSGSAVLLEVARALAEGGERPPVTVYLLWFGSEELGLYGSLTWANAHPDVVRDAIAMIEFDCLGHPPADLTPTLKLAYWSDGLASQRSAVPATLAGAAQEAGVDARPSPSRSIISDYAAFAAFGVPCLNVSYEPITGNESALAIQYNGHLHCPYDTIELAQQEARGLVSMARLAAVAVSELPRREPEPGSFCEFPTPTRRALFVGSHTEAAHMMPAGSPELGRTLAAGGYAVDTVPCGTPVTAETLQDATLVIVMPTIDYGNADGPVAWSADEVAALENYVRAGGLLVLTNSVRRLKYRNWRMEGNEDSLAMNSLSEGFGVRFGGAGIAATSVTVVSDHALVSGLDSLQLTYENAVPFTLSGSRAEVLARAGGSPVVALVDVGEGQVLVLGEMGLLGSRLDQEHHPFWRRLAQYAAGR